jgi:hypothetical protein
LANTLDDISPLTKVTPPVPEAGSVLLLGTALAGLATRFRKRLRSQNTR